MLKEYYPYDDIKNMPLKNLMQQVKYFTPKFKEIAKRREQERLKMELEGKKKSAMQRKNSNRQRRS